jgi:hypothetical protein
VRPHIGDKMYEGKAITTIYEGKQTCPGQRRKGNLYFIAKGTV